MPSDGGLEINPVTVVAALVLAVTITGIVLYIRRRWRIERPDGKPGPPSSLDAPGRITERLDSSRWVQVLVDALKGAETALATGGEAAKAASQGIRALDASAMPSASSMITKQ